MPLPLLLRVQVQDTPVPEGTAAIDPAFDLSLAVTYDAGVGGTRYAFTGSGTKALGLDALPAAGAKMVLVFYEAGEDPITVNGVQLTEGGVFIVINPSPDAGLTALSVVHASAATIRAKVVG